MSDIMTTLRARIAQLVTELTTLKTTRTEARTSPLAPAGFADLPVIGGIEVAEAAAGVRYTGRPDTMLTRIAAGSSIAGVFTRSGTRAASVLDCEVKLAALEAEDEDRDSPFAFIVSSGNANAFTGRAGTQAVKDVSSATAAELGLPETHVFTSFTGVIGEPLPTHKIIDILGPLAGKLAPDTMASAAQAIMTTDTFPKGASATVCLGAKTVRIAGIAKGSGMIAPDMATMLAYVFTDAAVDQTVLQSMTTELIECTFNCITVDGDTSTSDTFLIAATGASGAERITDAASPDGRAFQAALRGVMLELAHQVVRDGEGATKFVEIRVTGAQDHTDAHRVAMAIANSPLVKTAIAGEDPNWGRVVMAVGKSGAKVDRDKLSIWFGDVLIADKGWASPIYEEKDGTAQMKKQDVSIRVDLGIGQADRTVWTCDLTHRYIEINAEYRS